MSETRMTAIVLKQDPHSQKERLFNVIIQNVRIFGVSPAFEATKQVVVFCFCFLKTNAEK